MVQKFVDFVNEGLNSNQLTYSVITALAVFKPEYFSFLDSIKNRYFLTDNSFWQGFILEIKQTPELKLDKQHLMDIKGISVENDWVKIKKCVSAAQEIQKTFSEITSIRVLPNSGMMINGTELLRSKREEDKLTADDVTKYLGFDGRAVYSHSLWKYMVSHWVESMKKHLNPEYRRYYDMFLDKIEESNKELDWKVYKNFKIKGLGIRIESLPKLYYNSFYELNLALSTLQHCFTDYKAFVLDWLNFKNDVLNKKILHQLINSNKSRNEHAKNMVVKYYSLDNKKYYRFDNKMNVIEVPSLDEFNTNSSVNITEKFLTNSRNDLIILIKSEEIRLKIMVAMKGLCPSTIIIKSKYEEVDGLSKMGKL
jgi:hypothetical protein